MLATAAKTVKNFADPKPQKRAFIFGTIAFAALYALVEAGFDQGTASTTFATEIRLSVVCVVVTEALLLSVAVLARYEHYAEVAGLRSRISNVVASIARMGDHTRLRGGRRRKGNPAAAVVARRLASEEVDESA